MKLLTIAVFLALLLVGCRETSEVGRQTSNITNIGDKNYVYRHIDRQAGVVCWVYNSANKGGIDCMPISDTELELKRE